MTHICVGNLTITGSDNGLLPGRHQAIIWANVGILSIGSRGTTFSREILVEIHTFSFTEIHLKMSSAKWRPFLSRPQCGLNVIEAYACGICITISEFSLDAINLITYLMNTANPLQLDCSSTNLFRLTTKTTSRLCIPRTKFQWCGKRSLNMTSESKMPLYS